MMNVTRAGVTKIIEPLRLCPRSRFKTWMPGTRPGMTREGLDRWWKAPKWHLKKFGSVR
jgi:hypothetical protein